MFSISITHKKHIDFDLLILNDITKCYFILKAKTFEAFSEWVKEIKQHRLYRQHVLTFGQTKQTQSSLQKKTSCKYKYNY